MSTYLIQNESQWQIVVLQGVLGTLGLIHEAKNASKMLEPFLGSQIEEWCWSFYFLLTLFLKMLNFS